MACDIFCRQTSSRRAALAPRSCDLLAAGSGFKVGICALRASHKGRRKQQIPHEFTGAASTPTHQCSLQKGIQTGWDLNIFLDVSVRPQSRKPLGSVRCWWENVNFCIFLWKSRRWVWPCSAAAEMEVGIFPGRFGLDGLGTSQSHQRHSHLKWWGIFCWNGKTFI